MPTGVSLFVWLPEERAKWVEMRAKRDRAIRATFGHHTDYAEVCVKPRICGGGLRSWEVSLDFSAYVSLVTAGCRAFGVGLPRRSGSAAAGGVDRGGGGVDRLPHHVQGRKGIERCCSGSVFVAEEAHDDRQRDTLLVESIALVLRSRWQWMFAGIERH